MIKKMLLVLILLVLLALGGLSSTVLAIVVEADETDGTTTSDLQVEAISSADIGAGYLQVEAIMSGTVIRPDGSQGTYKVPVSLVYPQESTKCNGVGLLDIINSVFYETFPSAGTQGDLFFPSLFPVGRLLLGDDFIKDRGYVYAHAQWNKLVIERQRDADTLPNSAFHIEQGTDGYFVLRDISRFFRTPADVFVGTMPTPCAVDDVISFGYSQTGMLLRQFYFAELNTGLATNPAFDDGLVFEGAIHAVPGSHCRSLSNESPWFSYSFKGCGGETPGEQGKVITINTETDVQIINGWKARPEDDDQAGGHYRVYEIAGTSHLSTPLFPLKLVGLRPPDGQEQNYADTAPVFRAMVQHLQNWIKDNGEPPQNALIQGNTGKLDTPLFSSNSWGSDGKQVRIMKLGEDGNVLRGVRLPHIRTILPGNQQIGGPLGAYRGTECDNDPSQSDFVLDCQLSGDFNIYNMAGGTFKPYTEFNPAICNTFYDSYEAYVTAVINAAEYAVAEGWVIPEEVDALVLAAELNAEEFPGCVPENTN